MAEKWIQDALSKKESKGKLHRALHIKEGEKIPAKKLAKAEHSKDKTIRREANLAKTLGKLRSK